MLEPLEEQCMFMNTELSPGLVFDFEFASLMMKDFEIPPTHLTALWSSPLQTQQFKFQR